MSYIVRVDSHVYAKWGLIEDSIVGVYSGLLGDAAWLFGIIFILFGFLYLVFSVSNREGNVGARVIIRILALLIALLLCYGVTN